MANFEAKAFLFSDINNGQRYQNGDIPDAEAINKPIEASKYAVDLSRLALATAEGNQEGGSVGEEYLSVFATQDGFYPSLTAGKIGGNFNNEGAPVGGMFENPSGSLYMCYISANGSLFTSIVFVSSYHGISYGTTTHASGMNVFAYYNADANKIIPYASNYDGDVSYEANIIGYYRII